MHNKRDKKISHKELKKRKFDNIDSDSEQINDTNNDYDQCLIGKRRKLASSSSQTKPQKLCNYSSTFQYNETISKSIVNNNNFKNRRHKGIPKDTVLIFFDGDGEGDGDADTDINNISNVDKYQCNEKESQISKKTLTDFVDNDDDIYRLYDLIGSCFELADKRIYNKENPLIVKFISNSNRVDKKAEEYFLQFLYPSEEIYLSFSDLCNIRCFDRFNTLDPVLLEVDQNENKLSLSLGTASKYREMRTIENILIITREQPIYTTPDIGNSLNINKGSVACNNINKQTPISLKKEEEDEQESNSYINKKYPNEIIKKMHNSPLLTHNNDYNDAECEDVGNNKDDDDEDGSDSDNDQESNEEDSSKIYNDGIKCEFPDYVKIIYSANKTMNLTVDVEDQSLVCSIISLCSILADTKKILDSDSGKVIVQIVSVTNRKDSKPEEYIIKFIYSKGTVISLSDLSAIRSAYQHRIIDPVLPGKDEKNRLLLTLSIASKYKLLRVSDISTFISKTIHHVYIPMDNPGQTLKRVKKPK
jgi:hypothetical protein